MNQLFHEISKNKADSQNAVYFGEEAGNIIILCDGHKDSHDRDIENTKAYWKKYRVTSITKSMGYCLVPQKLPSSAYIQQ
jgi:hypothetical protein